MEVSLDQMNLEQEFFPPKNEASGGISRVSRVENGASDHGWLCSRLGSKRDFMKCVC